MLPRWAETHQDQKASESPSLAMSLNVKTVGLGFNPLHGVHFVRNGFAEGVVHGHIHFGDEVIGPEIECPSLTSSGSIS